jgi:hypothetical protein
VLQNSLLSRFDAEGRFVMIDLNHIRYVLDDTQHPGTAPAWFAITIACLVVVLVISHIKSLVHTIRRSRSSYDASLAYHQKIHEGERW